MNNNHFKYDNSKEEIIFVSMKHSNSTRKELILEENTLFHKF